LSDSKSAFLFVKRESSEDYHDTLDASGRRLNIEERVSKFDEEVFNMSKPGSGKIQGAGVLPHTPVRHFELPPGK
jgi:hypothetical protein